MASCEWAAEQIRDEKRVAPGESPQQTLAIPDRLLDSFAPFHAARLERSVTSRGKIEIPPVTIVGVLSARGLRALYLTLGSQA